MSQSEHKAQAPAVVACYVLTVSDTRTPETDTSGMAIRALVESAGHQVPGHAIVKDDPTAVSSAVLHAIDAGARVVLVTGGTGITARDGSYEAIAGLLEKRLDGFGELFRMLSYADIGAAAMLSRAVAGTHGRAAIFLMPGSEKAVRLAMEKLILPELGHIVQQVSK